MPKLNTFFILLIPPLVLNDQAITKMRFFKQLIFQVHCAIEFASVINDRNIDKCIIVFLHETIPFVLEDSYILSETQIPKTF